MLVMVIMSCSYVDVVWWNGIGCKHFVSYLDAYLKMVPQIVISIKYTYI